MMTDEQFEQLWQRAEAKHYSDAMMQEYPRWERRRRKQRRVAMSVVGVMVATVACLPLLRQPDPVGYDHVYCNRTHTSDAQWVDLASDLLLLS